MAFLRVLLWVGGGFLHEVVIDGEVVHRERLHSLHREDVGVVVGQTGHVGHAGHAAHAGADGGVAVGGWQDLVGEESLPGHLPGLRAVVVLH